MVRNVLAISAFLAILTACSAPQVASSVTTVQSDAAKVQTALNSACTDVSAAEAAVGVLGAVPAVNNVEAYANSACVAGQATAAIVSAALNDPTTVAWVEQLAAQLLALKAQVKVS